MPLSKIDCFIDGETGIPGENHRPVASY